jgi:YbgC/YbaW family acyl-CoA thioester hydrolase
MNALFAAKSEWESQVRAQECDGGAAVYYANYAMYMHEARAKFLADAGVDLTVLNEHGLGLMVAQQSVRHIKPLRARERFVVLTSVVSAGPQTVTMSQQVIEKFDRRLCAESTVVLQLVLNDKFDFQLSSDLAEVVRRSKLSTVLA